MLSDKVAGNSGATVKKEPYFDQGTAQSRMMAGGKCTTVILGMIGEEMQRTLVLAHTDRTCKPGKKAHSL